MMYTDFKCINLPFFSLHRIDIHILQIALLTGLVPMVERYGCVMRPAVHTSIGREPGGARCSPYHYSAYFLSFV
jgi:hypothetical protein